ncbi:MAG: hypothetical protein HFI09_00330 [Bacilli bacterium]|nr:hypothetical protein [Bacilli bacterium]
MSKIYIILMHTKTIPAKLIKWVTHSNYSHVALSFEKECNTLYSFGRRNLHSIINSGFTIEKKKGPFFQTFNKTTCKIYEVEIEEEKYQRIKKIILEMQRHKERYKYDFIGLVLRYFKIPIRLKNHYVCSYFLANLLEESGVYTFAKKSYFVRPKDFENIAIGNEIYQGEYQKYK